MKRKIFFLLSLIGLIIVIIAGIRLLTNRGPKEGELRVDSQPIAAVFLDNKNIGKTPYKDKVKAGEYTIKLVPESASGQIASWEGKILVGENLLTYVNANLQDSELATAVDVVWLEKITSKSSELSVTTNPDGATVLVDDVSRGITPLSVSDILAGEHNLSVTSTGFFPRSIKIKTTAGYRLIANLKLALSSGEPLASATATPVPDTSETPKTSGTPKASPTKTATSSGTKTQDPQKPYVVIKDTPTGFLRVRVAPSTSATESARVNPGEKFSYKNTENGWYEIQYEETKTGWVSGQYVEKVE